MKVYFKNKWSYYLAGLVIFIVILFEARNQGDFNIFLSASADLYNPDKNIYTALYNKCYLYFYDLLFALILRPFTYLPLYVVKVIWLSLNVFFLCRIWTILKSWLPLEELDQKSKSIFTVLAFVFIFSFIRDNFHYAQVTIFILYLLLEGIHLIISDRKIQGSALIAFGINMKILPIVILPYLIYRKEWKPVIYIVGFSLLYFCIPILFIGYDRNYFLLMERWKSLNPSNVQHIVDTSEKSFHSLTTFFAALLIENPGGSEVMPLKRNIADISIEHLNLIINAARVILIVFFLYFLRSRPFRIVTSNLQRLYELSYLCLITPLIFPHQQHYAFFFIFPATTYLIYYMIRSYYAGAKPSSKQRRRRNWLIGWLSLSYFLTNCRFLLGVFNNYYDHYKLLTYGVFILLILLAVCRPIKLPQNALTN